MPSQIVDQVQAALVALLAARPGLSGVQVSDGFTGEDETQPERVFTGDARSLDVTPAGLRSGRTFYNEDAELDVVVQVLTPDKTPAQAKTRCLAIGTEVALCVADNRTLGALAGLNWVVVARWDQRTLYGATGGAIAEMTYTLRYNARLT